MVRHGGLFTFFGLNDGKSIFSAERIGTGPHLGIVGLGIAVVFPAIVQSHRTPHNVIVIVFGIEVSGNHRLKTALQQLLRQLHPDLVSQFRRDFALGETLDKVVSLHTGSLLPALYRIPHIPEGGFTYTTESGFKAIRLRLIPVEGVVHRVLQRLGTARCLGFIPHIVHRSVQAADGDNGCIGHSSSSFLPGFSGSFPFGLRRFFRQTRMAEDKPTLFGDPGCSAAA